MTYVWITAGAAVVFIVFVVVMTRENRRDDGEDDPWDPFPPHQHPGFGDIPRYEEIAHDEFAPVQRWHEETSPVRTHPASPGGTAAAAGQSGTHPCPPPLPTPWQVANHPDREPFTVWDPTTPGSDDLVQAVIDLKAGAS